MGAAGRGNLLRLFATPAGAWRYLRATVGTSVPTFVRATAVPMTLAFLALRDRIGMAGAAATVGGTALLLAALAVWRQSETYGTDLDFVEG